jgi:hypothetical protein
VDWLVEASVSDYHTVSIFRVEPMSWDSKGLYRVTRGENLKKRANQNGVRLRLSQANEERPTRHKKRGMGDGRTKSALFRAHGTGLILWCETISILSGH